MLQARWCWPGCSENWLGPGSPGADAMWPWLSHIMSPVTWAGVGFVLTQRVGDRAWQSQPQPSNVEPAVGSPVNCSPCHQLAEPQSLLLSSEGVGPIIPKIPVSLDSLWWPSLYKITPIPFIFCYLPSVCWSNLYHLYLFFFFGLFRAVPEAYGGSQARGLIGAVATGLHHSRSNSGSEPCLRPIPQLMATPDP